MSEHGGRYQRSTSGLVGAMVIVVLVILALVGFRALISQNDPTPVSTVDYLPVLRQARQQGAVLAPAPRRDATWRATSVRYAAAPSPAWHLGGLTPDQLYIGIEEQPRPVSELLQTYVDSDMMPGSVVHAGGVEWRSWTDSQGDYVLTRRQQGESIVVGGSAHPGQVRAFASGLSYGRLVRSRR